MAHFFSYVDSVHVEIKNLLYILLILQTNELAIHNDTDKINTKLNFKVCVHTLYI